MSRRHEEVLTWMNKNESVLGVIYRGRGRQRKPAVLFLERTTLKPIPNYISPSVRYSTIKAMVDEGSLILTEQIINDKRFKEVYETAQKNSITFTPPIINTEKYRSGR